LTRTSFASNQHYHVSQLYYVSLINITRVLNTYIIKSKVIYIFVTKREKKLLLIRDIDIFKYV